MPPTSLVVRRPEHGRRRRARRPRHRVAGALAHACRRPRARAGKEQTVASVTASGVASIGADESTTFASVPASSGRVGRADRRPLASLARGTLRPRSRRPSPAERDGRVVAQAAARTERERQSKLRDDRTRGLRNERHWLQASPERALEERRRDSETANAPYPEASRNEPHMYAGTRSGNRNRRASNGRVTSH